MIICLIFSQRWRSYSVNVGILLSRCCWREDMRTDESWRFFLMIPYYCSIDRSSSKMFYFFCNKSLYSLSNNWLSLKIGCEFFYNLVLCFLLCKNRLISWDYYGIYTLELMISFWTFSSIDYNNKVVLRFERKVPFYFVFLRMLNEADWAFTMPVMFIFFKYLIFRLLRSLGVI